MLPETNNTRSKCVYGRSITHQNVYYGMKHTARPDETPAFQTETPVATEQQVQWRAARRRRRPARQTGASRHRRRPVSRPRPRLFFPARRRRALPACGNATWNTSPASASRTPVASPPALGNDAAGERRGAQLAWAAKHPGPHRASGQN
jgi:hypothetical protein